MATVYDISKDEFVEVEDPAEQEEKTAEDQSEKEEEEKEEDDDSEKEEEEKEEESEEESEESEKEEPEAKKEEEESEKEEEEKEEVDTDSFIKDQFGEEFGIESKEAFIEVLNNATSLIDENDELKKQIEEAKKPSEPVFKSETQKKIYEALKDYDPEKLPDGISSLAGLVNLDLNNTDRKTVLEQEFIMLHPELSLERARKKFDKRYTDKFTIKDKDNYSATELKEMEEDIDSDIEMEFARAKKFLAEKKEEFKVKIEDKKEEKPEVNEAVESSIAKNTKEFSSHMDGLDTLTWETDNGKENFNYKFSKEQLSKISETVNSYLNNPASYDEKGKLKEQFDPELLFQRASHIVAGPQMMQEALNFAQNYAQKIKADEIAKKKPKREAKSSGEVKSMSIDAQAERLAEKKANERRNG